ncbi:hypothetical protein AJ87_26200 [Rhizobium yanglingense]|nr:hypothetical protein AJ87_26200 [Rhizobium yanglingense]
MLDEVIVVRQAACFENAVNHFPGAKAEAWLIRNAEALCELLDDKKVGAHRRRRFDEFRAEQDMVLAAGAVDVVMLDEHRGGNDDIGHFRRLGHELLVYGHEEIAPRKAALHKALLRRNVHRIGVLNKHGGDRSAMAE